MACSTLPERPPDLADSHHWPSQDLQAFTVVQPPGTEATGVHLLEEATDAGALIVANTIRVADRGVQVRLLVDDLDLLGLDQRALVIYSHPNIDIRSFNPFRYRKRFGPIRRTFDILIGTARGRYPSTCFPNPMAQASLPSNLCEALMPKAITCDHN